MVEDESKFFGASLKGKFIFVVLSIMALGQWADTKALLEESYQSILSNFTHRFEYEDLDAINIGNNIAFIEDKFGPAQLIKNSKYIDDIQFIYYFNSKYILTIILQETRVSAYTITSIEDDFSPNDLINKKRQQSHQNIATHYEDFTEFGVDINNVDFLLIQQELGKSKLFINKFFGAIDYLNNTQLNSSELKALYDKVNMDEERSFKQEVNTLAQKARNNFYGAGEVDLSVIADSVLTDFEYSLIYKM